ncbi:tetratricopeptide repeat protein [Kiloniella laminariae]|uniref:tetratricopeptide repeat-containing glycosyltransferase family protein n=1 Tax=Kiloniella laminariae TaxID=454162 RepID=UPI000378C3A9|nr:tetratricopeptide repeat-containing glycosyltransferase family protein [Kiloniella laminariae]
MNKSQLSFTNNTSPYKKGVLSSALNCHEEAIEFFGKAIETNPENALAYYNRGNSYRVLGKINEALESYIIALKIAPDNADIRWNTSLLYLLTGDYQAGWALHHSRKELNKPPRTSKLYHSRVWQGQNLKNKTILIHPEQGFGDFIQFSRYANLLKTSGAIVILETHKNLYRLYKTQDIADKTIHSEEETPTIDFHTSVIDLPAIFNTTLETIPNTSPYLHPPKEIKSQWAKRIGPKDLLRVGLAYQGNPKHTNDANRSINSKLFEHLTRTPNIAFYNLQISPTKYKLNTTFDLTNDIKDFADTAGLISNLDLVVTVDTSIAHLAGALNVPTWILLPKTPDWRWLLNRNDSPWYPSMKLFRQSRRGNWTPVINEVINQLSRMSPKAI